MTSVPLLIFIMGHVSQVKPQYVFGAMAIQFIMIFLGYLADLLHGLVPTLLCFSIAAVLYCTIMSCIYILTVSLSHHRYILENWRNKQNIVLNQTMVKALGLSTGLLWLAFPTVFILNVSGILSPRASLLSSPFLDVMAKGVFVAILNAIHSQGETKRMEGIVEELKEDHEKQSQFLRFVYHEIRNPFNSIMLGLNHLEEEDQLLPYRELIVMLRRSAKAMSRVIDDVVELTQGKGLQLIKEPFSVKALTSTAISNVAVLASSKDIEIHPHFSKIFPPRLVGDSEKLRKVYEVLLSNAVKFSPSNTKITVKLQVLDMLPGVCTFIFSVKDRGPGVATDIAPLLFQPFAVVRPGDFSEDENRGSGLGLCIAKHLIDLMGGTLSFSSNKDQDGSTFTATVSLETCPSDDISGDFFQWTQVFTPNNKRRKQRKGSVLACAQSKEKPQQPNAPLYLVERKQTQESRTSGQRVAVLVSESSDNFKSIGGLSLMDPESGSFASLNDAVHPEKKLPRRISAPMYLTNEAPEVVDFKLISPSKARLGRFGRHRDSTGSSHGNGKNGKVFTFEALDSYEVGIGRNLSSENLLWSPSRKNTLQHPLRSPLTSKSVSFAPPLEGERDDCAGDEGAVKKYTIKVSLAEMEAKCMPVGPEPAKESSADNSSLAQVLIVDDVKSNQKLVHLILKKAGYLCDVASDGQEAVQMASRHHYQLILMDNVMPVMDGVQATRQIIAADGVVAIVGLTGNVLQKDQLEFLQAGAKFIIEKPANKDRLLEACKMFVTT